MQRTWRKSDVVGCIYLLNRRLPVIGPVRSGCVVKGLVLSETAHGSSHDLDAHVGYQGKRTARLHNNEQVTQRNKQRGEQRRHAAHKALTAGVCGAKLSVALQSQNNDHTQALAPVKHLIDDMTGLLRHVQAVANALERPLSSGALAKRVARILDAAPPPQNQSELQTALLAMEVVFAAKRRPHLVAAVLDAVPVKQRQHFENIVASVLGVACSRFRGQRARMGVDPIGFSFSGLTLHGFAKKRHPPRRDIDVSTFLY